MKQRGLVHPHMLARLQPNFYPSVCTFFAPNATINSFGEEVYAPTPVAGLEEIACRFAPKSSRETRAPQQTFTEATHHIALNGHYPTVTPALFVEVDGVMYSQEGEPEHDGNGKTTRVYVREVSP